ncbi:hypothetical protein CCR75_002623 [Bremia lactucae]|uniref:Septum formation inhibitor MinC C-terminal domain-containing protein n=1 Tax=Bremia lactucae TaxID=4779 RepID=A0A976ILF1_BRELC|nr:hypothetical protein CCR75_002623 [Bremia lactucae]
MHGLIRTSRRRAFSQEALRRFEEISNGRHAYTVKLSPSTALELDGRLYLLPTLILPKVSPKETKDSSLVQARVFRPTAIVLDLQRVSSDGSPHSQSIKKHELRNEILQLQKAGYIPVGITNASEDVKKAAAALNLPYVIGTRLQQQKEMEAAVGEESSNNETVVSHNADFTNDDKAVPSTSSLTSAKPLSPMVITHSVRSGQQIFAQNRSLVILGNVNSGAEVMADEDVVVLGALKGRALAGIGGNVHARVLCHSFDAELISIAHCFTTYDDLDESGSLQQHKPTAISLENHRLHFESSSVGPKS